MADRHPGMLLRDYDKSIVIELYKTILSQYYHF